MNTVLYRHDKDMLRHEVSQTDTLIVTFIKFIRVHKTTTLVCFVKCDNNRNDNKESVDAATFSHSG